MWVLNRGMFVLLAASMGCGGDDGGGGTATDGTTAPGLSTRTRKRARVGLYRIELFDMDQEYGAFVTRFGRAAAGSDATYSFAFPLQATSGQCDSGPIPASTMDPATNWGEIANPTLRDVTARVLVKNSSGQIVYNNVRLIKSFSPRAHLSKRISRT